MNNSKLTCPKPELVSSLPSCHQPSLSQLRTDPVLVSARPTLGGAVTSLLAAVYTPVCAVVHLRGNPKCLLALVFAATTLVKGAFLFVLVLFFVLRFIYFTLIEKSDLQRGGVRKKRSPSSGCNGWNWTSQKPGGSSRSSMWMAAARALGPSSVAFHRPLQGAAWKWNSRDTNKHTFVMPALLVVALKTMPQHWPHY